MRSDHDAQRAIQAGYAAVASMGSANLTSQTTRAAISFDNNGSNLEAYLEAHPEWRSPMGH